MIKVGWRAFFAALHLCEAIIIAFLLYRYPFVDKSLYQDVKSSHDANVLNIAVQLGRLDLASMALALVGLIIGASAIFAFFTYGHIVEKAAKKETNEIAFGIISKILRDDPQLWVKVIRENPELMRSAIQDAGIASENTPTDMSGDDANAIAAVSAEDGNGKLDL